MNPSWISAICNIVVAGATVVAAVTAIKSLRTWRRQMQAQIDYKIARRVLKASYKLGQAFAYVRSPSGYVFGHLATNHDEQADQATKKFDKRWQVLEDAMQDLETEILEARVIWGNEIDSHMRKIRQCKGNLFMTIVEHIEAIRNPERTTPEERKKLRHQVYSHGTEDTLSGEISEALKSLEEELRRHLEEK